MIEQTHTKKNIEETIVNCLTCLLIFLLLHDIICSVCAFLIKGFLEQDNSNRVIHTFLQNNQTILASCIGNIVGIPFLIYWIRKYNKEERTKLAQSTNIKLTICFVIVAICASITLNGILILSGVTKIFASDYEQTANQLYGGTLVVTVLFSGILAPITEELLYRRILYRQMHIAYGFGFACIASSIIFGVAHMAIVQGIYGFLTGMLLCYCYEVGKGVKTSIFVHMIMNITSMIGTQFLYTMSSKEQTLVWIIGSIVGTCILVVFIMKTKSKLPKNKSRSKLEVGM